MSRIQRRPRSSLDGDQAAVFEEIVSGARGSGVQTFRLIGDDGALEGPFNAMLLSPEVGGALQRLGAALRFKSRLTGREREVAILVVAGVWDSAFEIYAHTAVGRQVGLLDEEIDSLLRSGLPESLNRNERMIGTVARCLSEGRDVDDDLYERARDILGEAAMFELSTLVGYYACLALQLRLFRVSAPG